jgi:hypothetical protein
MAKKIKGAGDLVKVVTDAVGIEQCPTCKKNQSWLNVNFAFNKPKPLTEEQKQRIETEPLQVYNEAFNMNIEEEMFKDGVKKAILKKLNKLKDYEK